MSVLDIFGTGIAMLQHMKITLEMLCLVKLTAVRQKKINSMVMCNIREKCKQAYDETNSTSKIISSCLSVTATGCNIEATLLWG